MCHSKRVSKLLKNTQHNGKSNHTYNGVLGAGTFSDRAFLYQSVAKDTNDAMSYLGML